MLPLNLDVRHWRILVVGRGQALMNRIKLVEEAGAMNMCVHMAGDIGGDGAQRAWLPSEAEIGAARILLVAGLPDAIARDLACQARRLRVLVNVEDKPELCDFHVPALVRRGDLSIAISTAGKGPGLASALRRYLERQFGAEWAGHVEAAASLRARMRADGMAPAAIAGAMRKCAARWLQAAPP